MLVQNPEEEKKMLAGNSCVKGVVFPTVLGFGGFSSFCDVC